MLALESALDVWDGVDLAEVRAKSLALTDFFLECVAAYVPEGTVRSLTPTAHAERGSQVALACAEAPAVMRELVARGVVGDLRRPDVLRFGFTRCTSGSRTPSGRHACWPRCARRCVRGRSARVRP